MPKKKFCIPEGFRDMILLIRHTYETWLNTRQPTSTSCRPTLSATKEMLYTQRYEEGYDLLNPKYEAWLNIHHPNAEITSDVIALSPIPDVMHHHCSLISMHFHRSLVNMIL